MKIVTYEQLEAKYLALMSPRRLFHNEAAVQDFLKEGTTEEITAFIARCVEEESFELAGYADKVLKAHQGPQWFAIQYADTSIEVRRYLCWNDVRTKLQKSYVMGVAGPERAQTKEEALEILKNKMPYAKK